jgi:hypothetical protein
VGVMRKRGNKTEGGTLKVEITAFVDNSKQALALLCLLTKAY